jgi:nucleoid-associated protein YgaU
VNYGIGKISEYRRRLGNIALSAENLGIDVPARYTSAAFIYGIASDSHGLTNSLVQLRERFASLADTTPQARYRVVEGDTLQTIASKFYNDASLWENIYKHNNLSTTLLVSGTVLEIPRL